ncbi:MAG TPA: phosphatase PAP2 family protein [Roseiarcus sp.]|nr:phosphatase PAP2 family protein [Roseiarcus sp.]
MKALFVYAALTALTLAVFALWPQLDLIAAHHFYDGGGFIGHDGLDRFGRDVFRVTPFVVLALYAGLWLAKRRGVALRWAPSGRAIVFLIATMAIGPGLVVNLGLKDHWHRPRPNHVQEFGGSDAFRRWYENDGACKKNCSFVSGEAATGFWMVAPASLLPPPWRTPAIAGAFAFGAAASLLRMAFGSHFLSDVLLGGFLTLIVIEVVRLLLWPPRNDKDELGQTVSRAPLMKEEGRWAGGRTAADIVDAALRSASAAGKREAL